MGKRGTLFRSSPTIPAEPEPPILALILASLLTAPPAPNAAPNAAPDCRSELAASAATWIGSFDPGDRARLNAWCRAVGPPALQAPEGAGGTASLDALAIVVWNANVGAGEVERLLRDLRSGALNGGVPAEEFVLLLQEVHREGSAVPLAVPPEARWAGRISGSGERADVVELARRQRLHLVYVPSMRNGSPEDGGALEDRGNAILSTLPLENPTAIELPVERQRRVAVAATVAVRSRDGVRHRIRLVSAHLENRARWTRIHRSFGAAQTRQARALVAALERLGPVTASAVGGDFNTWFGGGDAEALAPLRVRYASLGAHPAGATRQLPLFLPGLRLDHLFLRLPPAWSGEYALLDDRYGSDHVPLLGWIRTGSKGESLVALQPVGSR